MEGKIRRIFNELSQEKALLESKLEVEFNGMESNESNKEIKRLLHEISNIDIQVQKLNFYINVNRDNGDESPREGH